MNLSCSADVFQEMTSHAKALQPQEACGLLAGRSGEAIRFIPMKNTLASETAYEMDPAQLAATFRSLRENGEELVGIFHSHPRGPAVPSKSDIEQAFYPEAVHVIMSLAEPELPQIHGFRIIGGQSYEIELRAIV